MAIGTEGTFSAAFMQVTDALASTDESYLEAVQGMSLFRSIQSPVPNQPQSTKCLR